MKKAAAAVSKAKAKGKATKRKHEPGAAGESAAGSAVESQEITAPAPKVAKAKGKASPAGTNTIIDEQAFIDVVEVRENKKVMLLLLHLARAIMAPLTSLPKDKIHWSIVSRCCRIGLTFVWWEQFPQGVLVNGKELFQRAGLRLGLP